MSTRRKIHEHWTETHQIVNGKVKVTTCCCASPGSTTRECAAWAGNKSACRCDCHKDAKGWKKL